MLNSIVLVLLNFFCLFSLTLRVVLNSTPQRAGQSYGPNSKLTRFRGKKYVSSFYLLEQAYHGAREAVGRGRKKCTVPFSKAWTQLSYVRKLCCTSWELLQKAE